jgi:arylsulfatase A-like enzyme
MEPHYPYTPPGEFARRFRSEASTPGAVARARALKYDSLFGHNCGADPLPPATLAAIGDLYDAEIACLDAAIGRLADRLREEGILDRTVLVVTSDHGENLGDHGLVDHMFSLHRTICHVPLVVRYPARFAAGTVVDDVVRLEDVPPTLLELCGVPVPGDMDGRSLLADVPGRVSRAALDHPDRFLDRMRRDYPLQYDDRRLRADLRAEFDGRRHTIRYSDGRVETYDVPADPAELRNLTPGDEAASPGSR